MAARLGNVLYWFGLMVAVIAISGAVIWNGWTFYERREAQKDRDLTIKIEKRGSFDLWLEAESRGILPPEQQAILDEARQRKLIGPWNRYQTEAISNAWERRLRSVEQEQNGSLIMGGFLAVGGVVAFGFGWAARYILRKPVTHD